MTIWQLNILCKSYCGLLYAKRRDVTYNLIMGMHKSLLIYLSVCSVFFMCRQIARHSNQEIQQRK